MTDFFLVSTILLYLCNSATRNINGVILDEDTARIFLDKHNELRSQTAQGLITNQPSATYMNKLKWDWSLAAAAQVHSTTCPGGAYHSSDRENTISNTYNNYKSWEWDTTQTGLAFQTVGENVNWQPYNGILTPELVASYMERDWFTNEVKEYTYNYDSCSGSACGHYTQWVWADTRYVGCGYTSCQGDIYVHIVCQYYPSGNYYNRYSNIGRGTQPYYSGIQCNDCNIYASDRDTCINGLCDGCMNPMWDMCNNYYTNCDTLSCPSVTCTLSNEASYSLCKNCRTKCDTCGNLIGDSFCSYNGINQGISTPTSNPIVSPIDNTQIPTKTTNIPSNPSVIKPLSSYIDPICQFGIYNINDKSNIYNNNWLVVTGIDLNNPIIYNLLVNEYNNNNGIKCLQTYDYSDCCLSVHSRLFLYRNNEYVVTGNISHLCISDCIINKRWLLGNYVTTIYNTLSNTDTYVEYDDTGCGGTNDIIHPAIFANCIEKQLISFSQPTSNSTPLSTNLWITMLIIITIMYILY